MAVREYDPYLAPRDEWPDLVFTRPEFNYPETLNAATELLDVHVAAGHGGDPAVLFEDQRISYADLQRTTNRLGHALARLGVTPGDRVALRLPNRPVFVAAWLAIQKIGAVGVATMPMLRARELSDIVNDCGATVCLCAADLLDELIRAQSAFDHPVIVVGTPSGPSTPGVDYWLDAMTTEASGHLEAHATKRGDLA